MAEFAELMKQARRMCGSISCDNCILPRSSDEMCIWEDAPARLTDEVIAEIEAKTLKWAAENRSFASRRGMNGRMNSSPMRTRA